MPKGVYKKTEEHKKNLSIALKRRKRNDLGRFIVEDKIKKICKRCGKKFEWGLLKWKEKHTKKGK